ncbi:MAG: Clp protease ClpP [Clostridia bacterium]|nr:Clp protease ClpP [Clostridia bacterium]
MKKFWNYIRDDSGGRVLRLEGPIDEESFWGDEITPRAFREELEAEDGDLTVWINSPGGNVFAAAEIYTMLRDYKGEVTVRIASIAASAASVVAMAGSLVQMSPTALLMVHDPSTIAMGNTKDMERAIATLNEVKESIINAYAFKTGLTRNRISKLMENETWLNAKKAVELGFADEILFEDKPKPKEEEPDDPEEEGDDEDGKDGEEEEKKPFKLQGMWPQEGQLFSTRLMGQTILNRLGAGCQPESNQPEPEDAAPAPEPSEDGLKEPENTKPPLPLIGMDGRTEDGSMPYEILRDKLEWLK